MVQSIFKCLKFGWRQKYDIICKGPTECCTQGVTKYLYSSKRELNQVFWCYTLHIWIICSFWPEFSFKSVYYEYFKNGEIGPKWWNWDKMGEIGTKGWNWDKMVEIRQDGEIGAKWWKCVKISVQKLRIIHICRV